MSSRLIVVGLIAVVPMVAAAAGKPPKLPDTPALTTFRCTAGDPLSPSCLPVSVTDFEDRIRDDGGVYGFDLAKVQSSGFYNLVIPPGTGRALNLQLGAAAGTVPCFGTGNCNPDRPGVVDGDLTLDNASIALKPLVGAGPSELPGLLWGMPCNVTHQAKVHYTFTLQSGNGHWGFNFSGAAYPGSNNAQILRTGNTSWTVWTEGPNNVGELLSWDHSGLRRPQSGPSHEGFFHVNFQFTIEAQALASPSVACS